MRRPRSGCRERPPTRQPRRRHHRTGETFRRHDPAEPSTPPPAPSLLDVIFSYRFSNEAFAARELARWALKPVPAARGQPRPPRLICFSARPEAGRHASYQLTVHRNGNKAHVDAPGISADFTHRELSAFLTDTVTSWAMSPGKRPDDRA